MQNAIQNGPMTIAVAAGNDCWRFYSGGILTAANNCPTRIDHGVVVVGLVKAGGDGDGDGDGGDDDHTHNATCRPSTRDERRSRPKRCAGFEEFGERMVQDE